MNTRTNVFALIDYKEFYGEARELENALELIRDIPSLTIINYISGFSVNLYLHDNSEHAGEIQVHLLNNLIVKAGPEVVEQCKTVFKRIIDNGNSPMIFWNYSNLLFYDLAFKVHNNMMSRDLTSDEAKRVFDAYLIINYYCNSKIKLTEKDIVDADSKNKMEEITIHNFIYQKDYASTTDFSNQLIRGALFFEYLEKHTVYSAFVAQYYRSLNIHGWLRMFRNLMTLFTEARIGSNIEPRQQLVDLSQYGAEVDLGYIESLCINNLLITYAEDKKFSLLRRKMLYKVDQFRMFVLNPNFLIDQFYKAQVFSFNAFLKEKGVTNEFLSIKAKEFMEDIYLRKIINYAFPRYEKYFGDIASNSDGEELCDVYLRTGNKVIIVEFKDVLLNDEIKNSGNRDKLFSEFDIKFLKNEKKKQKGITQLLNAIKDINAHSISFDSSLPSQKLEIFPIIIYTDLSFGVEGLNKIYAEKFEEQIGGAMFTNIDLQGLTFINLSFFEIHEDYLKEELINIFSILEEYHQHIKNPDYILTTFEVFSRFYMNKNVAENLGTSKHFSELSGKIIRASN